MSERREWWISPTWADEKPHKDRIHVREVLPGDDGCEADFYINGECLTLAEIKQRLQQHARLHDKAETAYNAYDGNGEEAFNELMEDLGREIHGSE